MAVEYVQPNYLAALITKLESLPSLPGNVTKNGDGTYTYHYDAENGAAEMAKKPLHELTESELTELNSQIEARLARQQAAATKIQAIVRGRKGREEAQEVKAQTAQNEEPNDSWLFGPVEQHEVTVETGQTHVEMLAARRQADSIKSCCTIS